MATALVPLRGQYLGARTDRQATQGWTPSARSPNDDLLGDLPMLRARHRDAIRNYPLASSAMNTYVWCAIGNGLTFRPRVDREYLVSRGYLEASDAAGDEIEGQLSRVLSLWLASPWSSYTGTMNGAAQQRLTIESRLSNGDHFVVPRRRRIAGWPFTVSLQHIEADLVSTPATITRTMRVVDGIEYAADGVPVAAYVANHYPHQRLLVDRRSWSRVPLYDTTGRVVWHHADIRRSAQARGVPLFASGLESVKMLTDYAENELTAAINDSIFTVAYYSALGQTLLPDMVPIDPETGLPVLPAAGDANPALQATATLPAPRIKLGSGNVLNMKHGEELKPIESSRPAAGFTPFFDAQVKLFAASSGLAPELILRHFSQNFSASRGAINESWRSVLGQRSIEVETVWLPARELVIEDAIFARLIDLPGFFEDPLARQAWLGCQVTGPVQGSLNPLQDAKAAEVRVNTGYSSIDAEAAQHNGADGDEVHDQRAKETRKRVRDGLEAPISAARPVAVYPDRQELDDEEQAQIDADLADPADAEEET
jgi:lambda family phage portal protein